MNLRWVFFCTYFFFINIFLYGDTLNTSKQVSVQQIRLWVQQLGNSSFLERQRAETYLIQAGIQAYSELLQAKQHVDAEIAHRAEYILHQLEQRILNSETQETAFWLQSYLTASNPAFKVRIIWFLSDPGSDFHKGEGLQTLCRLVRFEENETLRLEAAKCLIASPPIPADLRKKWYQQIQSDIFPTDADELLQCVRHFADIWCEMDAASLRATMEQQTRVRQIGIQTLQILNRPENTIQAGSKIDILLHYAVAELQDAAGLNDERDRTLAQARHITAEPIRTTEPIEVIMSIVDDNLPLSEHFYVGWYLKQRYRFHWAIPHFLRAAESSDPLLQVLACQEAAAGALNLADYTLAIAMYDRQIEILKSRDYTLRFNDSARRTAVAEKRKLYCAAEKSAEENNWQTVQQHIEKAWGFSEFPDNESDIDLIILAHRLCQNQSDIPQAFKDQMKLVLKQVWQEIENDFHRRHPREPAAAVGLMCNTAAWLLANTEGDFAAALSFVKKARETFPEDSGILDTLAHVYFLGGNVSEAVRIQEKAVQYSPDSVLFRKALEKFRKAL